MKKIMFFILFVFSCCLFCVGCSVNKDKVSDFAIEDLFWISETQKNKQIADELLKGNLYVSDSIKDFSQYQIENIDWNIQIGNSPNAFQLYLQGLNPVMYLSSAYNMTKDNAYLDLGYKIVMSWAEFENNKMLSEKNEYVWDSHGMAIRTENIIYYLLTAKENDYLSKKQLENVHNILLKHKDYLMDVSYYHEKHNHGVIQDRASIVLGYYLNDENTDELIKTAKERLTKQWENSFTDEMVSTENSFDYQLFNRNLYQNIMIFLSNQGDAWGGKYLTNLHECDDVIGWFVKPNKKSSNHGESTVIEFDKPFGYEDSLVRYVTSDGQEGTIPKQNAVLYKDAGYYLSREYWNSDDDVQANASWVMFKSGFLSNIHKQDDDNSFEYYAKGYDIFVDPGFYGYVSNELRIYLQSAAGHNAISVDGKTYYAKKKEPGLAGIIYAELDESNAYDYVLGENNYFSGVELKRHFINFSEAILLIDECKSEIKHIYTQNFQCGSEMKLVSYDDTEVLMQIADINYFVRIKQLNENTKAKILYGSKGTNFGQYSPKSGMVEYIATIQFDLNGSTEEFATLITIEDENGNCIDFQSFTWDDINNVFSFKNQYGLDEEIKIQNI